MNYRVECDVCEVDEHREYDRWCSGVTYNTETMAGIGAQSHDRRKGHEEGTADVVKIDE